MNCGLIFWLGCWFTMCYGAPQPSEQNKGRLSNLSNYTNIATQFLRDVETRGTKIGAADGEASYAYYTDLTEENRKAAILASTLSKEFSCLASKNASMIREVDLSHDIARQIMLIRRNAMPLSQRDVAMLEELQANMTAIYSNGKVCRNNSANKTICMDLEPDLYIIMAKSRDYDELLRAWKEWRNAVGPPMRHLYQKFVDLLNLGARQHDWGDYGNFLRSEYEMGNDLTPALKKLWVDVKPLYQELHAYVRYELKKTYPQVSVDGPVHAHLFGNMWAQDWSEIFDLVQPFPKTPSLDVTPNLLKQQYTPEKMFKLAQSFFVSIGLDAMPASFWNKSMLRKPENKSVVCHASAWEFTHDDVRIKMCTQLRQEDLITVHHEMGHCEYFLAYKDLPYAYRSGANPGFHEAIGDTIALSIENPKHLKSVGLLYTVGEGDEAAINFLMMQALRLVAPLPFTYLVDQWRWRVFAGKVTSSNYNSAWWRLRTHYQGIAPPVPRNETDFDPGAKFHIGANSPYISYFVSLMLQFQFHRTLCNLAKQTGPIHECSIYKSKEAGHKFKEMLEAGRSRPWPQTLYRLTGEREMTASALMDYFSPLQKWLFVYRMKHKYPLGWKKAKKKLLTTDAVRKTLYSTKPGDSTKGTDIDSPLSDALKDSKSKGEVSFPASKFSNAGINLRRPDLKTALEEMQPNLKEADPSKKRESLLNAKSSILDAKPMFVPNKVKDQLNLGK